MHQVQGEEVVVDGKSLTVHDVVNVARNKVPVRLNEKNIAKINRSREYVDKLLAEQKVVYGLTTGFGKFSDTYISSEDSKALQLNLIRSHACAVGNPLPEETARATMLLRINALALGYSGIRLKTIRTMMDLLNRNVVPVIPEKGSLGASGDLAPLAHLALVLIGEGEAIFQGERMNGSLALASAGITPISLEAKEGLALINGTQVMTAIGAIACYDAIRLLKWADCTAALTCEALSAVRDAFDAETHKLRPHKGQRIVARNLRKLTKGSGLITKQGELRVQDAYSLRCVPQVHGASRDALVYTLEKLQIEMNSATDNPLIFIGRDRVISGGNFHGQPIALAMDFMAIAMSELANITERRIERLVNPSLNGQLPPFLSKHGGIHSGFMIAQYTAASLVSENKSLSHPASVDSIPSSGNQEDHVSMGSIAARKAQNIVENAYIVIAIELLCAAQATDFRDAGQLGKGTGRLYAMCRELVPFLEYDRVLAQDILTVTRLLKEEGALEELERIVNLQ
ncbi:histidine ammonia-lyase [Paenibacillus tarimensis]